MSTRPSCDYKHEEKLFWLTSPKEEQQGQGNKSHQEVVSRCV